MRGGGEGWVAKEVEEDGIVGDWEREGGGGGGGEERKEIIKHNLISSRQVKKKKANKHAK